MGGRDPGTETGHPRAEEETVARCESCGNDYDQAFEVRTAQGDTYVFDSIECAARVLAPVCVNCGTVILGHGIQDESHVFCCAHCARMSGTSGPVDRVSSGS
jgi:hypothetical protein